MQPETYPILHLVTSYILAHSGKSIKASEKHSERIGRWRPSLWPDVRGVDASICSCHINNYYSPRKCNYVRKQLLEIVTDGVCPLWCRHLFTKTNSGCIFLSELDRLRSEERRVGKECRTPRGVVTEPNLNPIGVLLVTSEPDSSLMQLMWAEAPRYHGYSLLVYHDCRHFFLFFFTPITYFNAVFH